MNHLRSTEMSNNGINNNNDYLDCPPLFGNNAVPNVSPQLGPLFAPGLGMAGTSHIGAGGADAEFQGAGTGANGFAPMPQAREIGFPAGLVAPGPSVFSGFNNVHMNPVPLASQSAFAQGLPQTLQNGLHHGLQYGPQQMPFNPAFQQPLLQGVQQGQAMQPSHNQSQLFCFPPNSFLFHPNSQVPQGFAMPPNQGAVPIPGDSQFGQAYTGMLMQPCIQPYGGNHVPVLEMNHPRQIVNPNNEGFMFPIKTSGPVMDPAISDTLNGQHSRVPSQTLMSPSSAVQMSHRNLSQASHSSHNPFHASSPNPALMLQRQVSQASHHSLTSQRSAASAPPSATVAYPAHPLPPHSPMHTTPQQMNLTSTSGLMCPPVDSTHRTHPTTKQDNQDVLLGVGVQSNMEVDMSTTVFQDNNSSSQVSTDTVVELPQVDYSGSEKEIKKLVRVNSQFAPLRILTDKDSQQELQPAFNYSQPLARNSRPQLQSAVTVTSETSFGLDSSSPLSSISATQGNSSYKKVNSAPPSAFGESTMRVPKVPTVPGSMLNQFAADMSHQSTNSEGNRNTKRRHSDDVDATTAALAKKAPRGGKKENGKRCLPCSISNRKCDNTCPCVRCGKEGSYYPVCVSPDFSDCNIFVEGLRPELKARAKDIIASGQEMSIDKPGMLLVFQVLSEYKTARPNFYQPFHEVNAKSNKFFATPFYQASIMLQAHDFLDAYAKEPHLTHLGPESEDVLRLWRAVSAARALKFITAMMDKNRMPNETPPNSDHAKFLVVNLATIFEQTEAYDKTLAAGTRMSEPLKEQQRQLNYQLAYRLRKMSDYAFGPDSGLAKNVHISKESASLDKAFWSQLGALWPHPVNEGAGDRVMTSSAHTTPATLVSATTSIDMNFATTPVAAQGFFSAPQISASLMPPATVMQRRESRASLTKKKSSQKPKKERERKEDDKWDDERDAADTNTIIAVRSPIRDGEPDKDLVDMIKAIEVLQIGEAISGPALDIDDGTMFLAGRLDGTAWTPDAGSPSDLFGNIYTADDDHITNNVDRSHGGVQIENEDGSITVPTVLSGSVDAPDLTNDVDSRDFDPGLDRVDSMALDAFMADSLKQAQAQDDANPNFDYGAMSSVPSSSELKVPNSNPHLMAGPTSAPNTSRPTTAASAASANSDNGLTAGRARACGSPSRSRSVRYLGKGKEAVRNMFRARNP